MEVTVGEVELLANSQISLIFYSWTAVASPPVLENAVNVAFSLQDEGGRI